MKWKLVPENPSKEQLDAGNNVGRGLGGSPPSPTWIYEAMIAAAPQPDHNRMTSAEVQAFREWRGMGGAMAWHVIERHADGWHQRGEMMDAWFEANSAKNAPDQSAE